MKCSKCGQEMQPTGMIPVGPLLKLLWDGDPLIFEDYDWQVGKCSRPGHGVEVKGTLRGGTHVTSRLDE